MGYTYVDDRASGGKLTERDTFQCPHCQRHHLKPLRKDGKGQASGAFCMSCGKPVCDRPPCNTRCVPFFRAIEKAMARDAMLRALGIG